MLQRMTTTPNAQRKLPSRGTSRAGAAAARRRRPVPERRASGPTIEYASAMAFAVGMDLVEWPLAIALLSLRAAHLLMEGQAGEFPADGIETRLLQLVKPFFLG